MRQIASSPTYRCFRRGLAISVTAIALLGVSPAFSQDSGVTGTITLGVLSDFSNLYSTAGGHGLIAGVDLAIEDFLAESPDPGFDIEVIFADHQHKPDVGAAIAKQWFEEKNVDAVLDVVNSSVAFAVAEETEKHNKVILISASGSARLTGELCSPNTIHWTYDTYEVGNAVGTEVTKSGDDTWFFLTADYSFGHDLEAGTKAGVLKAGGTIVGEVRHPVNTADFSSFLLQAQQSGAKVIGFANAGGDLVTSLKQAQEFGLSPNQRLAAVNANVVDIKALGLDAAQGATLAEPFYWDLNDSTRAWTKRFNAIYDDSYPTLHHAGMYASTLHYLRAVLASGSREGVTVVDQMKATPTHDGLFSDGRVRIDGRVIHDIYSFKVKSPEESKYDWDYYELVKTIPGDEAFRPLDEGGCRLVD